MSSDQLPIVFQIAGISSGGYTGGVVDKDQGYVAEAEVGVRPVSQDPSDTFVFCLGLEKVSTLLGIQEEVRLSGAALDEYIQKIASSNYCDNDKIELLTKLLDSFLAHVGTRQRGWLRGRYIKSKTSPVLEERQDAVLSEMLRILKDPGKRRMFIKQLAEYELFFRDRIEGVGKKIDELPGIEEFDASEIAKRNIVSEALSMAKDLCAGNYDLISEVLVFHQAPYVKAIAFKHLGLILPNTATEALSGLLKFVHIRRDGTLDVHDIISETMYENLGLVKDDISHPLFRLYLALQSKPPRYEGLLPDISNIAIPEDASLDHQWRHLQLLELDLFLNAYHKADNGKRTFEIDEGRLARVASQIGFIEQRLRGHEGDDKLRSKLEEHRKFLVSLVILDGAVRVAAHMYGNSSETPNDIQLGMLKKLKAFISIRDERYEADIESINNFAFGSLLMEHFPEGNIDQHFLTNLIEKSGQLNVNLRLGRLEAGQKEILGAINEMKDEVDGLAGEINDVNREYGSTITNITRDLAIDLFKRIIEKKVKSGGKVGELFSKIETEILNIRNEAIDQIAAMLEITLDKVGPLPSAASQKKAGEITAGLKEIRESGLDENLDRYVQLFEDILALAGELDCDDPKGKLLSVLSEVAVAIIKDKLENLDFKVVITALLPKLEELIPQLDPELAETISELKDHYSAFSRIANSVSDVCENILTLKGDVERYARTLTSFAQSLSGTSIQRLRRSWRVTSEELEGLEAKITQEFDAIAEDLDLIAYELIELDAEFEKPIREISQVVRGIKENIIDTFSITKINGQLKEMEKVIGGFVDRIAQPGVRLHFPVMGGGEVEFNGLFAISLFESYNFDTDLISVLGLDGSRGAVGIRARLKLPGGDFESFLLEAAILAATDINAEDSPREFFEGFHDQYELNLGGRFLLFGDLIPVNFLLGARFSDLIRNGVVDDPMKIGLQFTVSVDI